MSTASVQWSSNTLAVGPEGLRWIKPDRTIVEEPWSGVRSVRALVASASIEGVIPLGSWQHLGMELENGQSFYFHTRDNNAAVVAQLADRYATPYIVAKLWSQLEQGNTIQFGDLSLSRASIGYKAKRWPLSALAGYKTYQGHWMMDIGPKSAPRLQASIPLEVLPNHAALRIVLEHVRPGTEYVEGGPDLGTVLRPSASSHDPRYMSGRTRLLMLGGLFGTAALIGLALLVVFQLEERGPGAGRSDPARSMAAAMAQPVPQGKPWACAVTVESHEVEYAMRGPASADHPGVREEDEPFALSRSGSTIATGSRYFMFVELRSLSENGADQHRVATLAAQLLETENLSSVCAGEVTVRFADRDRFDVQHNLREALRMLTCTDQELDCKSAKQSVTVLDPRTLRDSWN